MKKNKYTSGSVILIILITVSLFAALTYAFLQNTNTNIAWLEKEKDSAAVIGAEDCSNNVLAATKRLEARGCEGLISSATDGSNANVGAPSDGSCSIYHPNGGGIKPCP